MCGIGSSASASSTRCSSPPDSAPMRLSISASPWTLERHFSTRPRVAFDGGKNAGPPPTQQRNRSSTLIGSPRSNDGLCGT